MMSSSSMIAPPSAMMPLHKLQQAHLNSNGPIKQHQQLASKPALPPSAVLSSVGALFGNSGIPSHIKALPKKPMRPLTAYHIFFQIEREYIIQTSAGEVADPSILENKVHLTDVPQRYRAIKLSPDWYAGPGKRQKRKHRKQHGKIGFLELSRVVSTRWAQLQTIDPETKAFVQKIAQKELDVYYNEMKEYKELTKDVLPESGTSPRAPPKKKKTTKKRSIDDNILLPVQQQQQIQPQQPANGMLYPDMIHSSSYQNNCSTNFMSPQQPSVTLQLQRDIDDFISRIDNNTKHLVPSSFSTRQQVAPPSFSYEIPVANINQDCNQGHFDQGPNKRMKTFHRQDSAPLSLSQFDALFVDHAVPSSIGTFTRSEITRTISDTSNALSSGNAGGCGSHQDALEVDLCDDEILQLWKSHN